MATSSDNYLYPNMTNANHSFAISLNEKLVTNSKIEGSKSIKRGDQTFRTIFKLHGKICQEEGCIQDMILGPCDVQGGVFVIKSAITKDVTQNN
jgi:hypothetical protein